MTDDRIQPRAVGVGTSSGGTQEQIVVVYVCPKCANYYGSSSMGELEKEAVIAPPTAKDAGQIRHMRSRCPGCGENRVKRYARLVPFDEVAEAERKVRAQRTRAR